MTRKGKRRWFQFSLRTLLIAVFLISLPLSWFAVRMEKARKQREAIAKVEDLGGRVLYDYECDYYEQIDSVWRLLKAKPPESPWPLWLREILGDDFLHSVAEVSLQPNFLLLSEEEQYDQLVRIRIPTDEDLDVLKAFPRLRKLSLDDWILADSQIKKLTTFSQLRHLSLSKTCITDEGLKHLLCLTKLEELYLARTQVTDAGLESLNELTGLKTLFLAGTQVTPEGVKKLQEALPDCEIVASDEERGT